MQLLTMEHLSVSKRAVDVAGQGVSHTRMEDYDRKDPDLYPMRTETKNGKHSVSTHFHRVQMMPKQA